MEAELPKWVYPEARSRICFSILVPTPSGFLSSRGQQAYLEGSGRWHSTKCPEEGSIDPQSGLSYLPSNSLK